MALLILVSFVWAFSFGLIKGRLAGLDPEAVAVVRLALAALVFLPTFRPLRVERTQALRLAAIGAVQFGLMYVFYLRAFAQLAAHEVALFTIFTPLYVAGLAGLLERRCFARHVVAAALAVAGAAVMLWQSHLVGGWSGFLFVQGSNLCFAAGQVAYRRVRGKLATTDAQHFGWLYLGALAVTAALSAVSTDWSQFAPTPVQWATLAYLGVLASGLAFFAWNLGALRVNAGTLAVFNNLKIPLAVAVSLLWFGEQADVPRLLISLALLVAAVAVAEKK